MEEVHRSSGGGHPPQIRQAGVQQSPVRRRSSISGSDQRVGSSRESSGDLRRGQAVEDQAEVEDQDLVQRQNALLNLWSVLQKGPQLSLDDVDNDLIIGFSGSFPFDEQIYQLMHMIEQDLIDISDIQIVADQQSNKKGISFSLSYTTSLFLDPFDNPDDPIDLETFTGPDGRTLESSQVRISIQLHDALYLIKNVPSLCWNLGFLLVSNRELPLPQLHQYLSIIEKYACYFKSNEVATDRISIQQRYFGPQSLQEKQRRLDHMVGIEEINDPREFQFDASVAFRLTTSKVEPVHKVSPPKRFLNSYMIYVLRYGPILSDSQLANMQGAIHGRVFQTSDFKYKYCKAPGTETLYQDDNGQLVQKAQEVVDFLRTKYLKLFKVFSDNQLRPVLNKHFPDGAPESHLQVLSPYPKKYSSKGITNIVIGFAMVINQLSDNTMILDKYFAAVAMCYMVGMPLIEIKSFAREFIDLERDKFFILDNDSIPFCFRSIYYSNSIDMVPAEYSPAQKILYFKDLNARTAHVFEVIWREIQAGKKGPWVIQIQRMAKKERCTTEWAVVKRRRPDRNGCDRVFLCNAAGAKKYKVSNFIDNLVSQNQELNGPFDYVLNYLHKHTDKSERRAGQLSALKKCDYYKKVKVFELEKLEIDSNNSNSIHAVSNLFSAFSRHISINKKKFRNEMFTVMYGSPKPSSKAKNLALSGSYLLQAEDLDDHFIENLLANKHFTDQFPFVKIESSRSDKPDVLIQFYFQNGVIPDLKRFNLLNEDQGISFEKDLNIDDLMGYSSYLYDRLNFIHLSMDTLDRVVTSNREIDRNSLKAIRYKINREKRFVVAMRIITKALEQFVQVNSDHQLRYRKIHQDRDYSYSSHRQDVLMQKRELTKFYCRFQDAVQSKRVNTLHEDPAVVQLLQERVATINDLAGEIPLIKATLVSQGGEKEVVFTIAEVLYGNLLQSLLFLMTIEAGKKYLFKEGTGDQEIFGLYYEYNINGYIYTDDQGEPKFPIRLSASDLQYQRTFNHRILVPSDIVVVVDGAILTKLTPELKQQYIWSRELMEGDESTHAQTLYDRSGNTSVQVLSPVQTPLKAQGHQANRPRDQEELKRNVDGLKETIKKMASVNERYEQQSAFLGTLSKDLIAIKECQVCSESYDTIDACNLPCNCGQIVCLNCYDKLQQNRVMETVEEQLTQVEQRQVGRSHTTQSVILELASCPYCKKRIRIPWPAPQRLKLFRQLATRLNNLETDIAASANQDEQRTEFAQMKSAGLLFADRITQIVSGPPQQSVNRFSSQQLSVSQDMFDQSYQSPQKQSSLFSPQRRSQQQHDRSSLEASSMDIEGRQNLAISNTRISSNSSESTKIASYKSGKLVQILFQNLMKFKDRLKNGLKKSICEGYIDLLIASVRQLNFGERQKVESAMQTFTIQLHLQGVEPDMNLVKFMSLFEEAIESVSKADSLFGKLEQELPNQEEGKMEEDGKDDVREIAPSTQQRCHTSQGPQIQPMMTTTPGNNSSHAFQMTLENKSAGPASFKEGSNNGWDDVSINVEIEESSRERSMSGQHASESIQGPTNSSQISYSSNTSSRTKTRKSLTTEEKRDKKRRYKENLRLRNFPGLMNNSKGGEPRGRRRDGDGDGDQGDGNQGRGAKQMVKDSMKK